MQTQNFYCDNRSRVKHMFQIASIEISGAHRGAMKQVSQSIAFLFLCCVLLQGWKG